MTRRGLRFAYPRLMSSAPTGRFFDSGIPAANHIPSGSKAPFTQLYFQSTYACARETQFFGTHEETVFDLDSSDSALS